MGGPLQDLEKQLGADWKAIRAARHTTDSTLARLRDALKDLDDPSCAVIVTGSLGRGEATEGSDADWILLVDGPSNPDHAILALKVRERILSIVKKDVGATGTFGNIVPSHELVHYIAGTRDTNENLTRRILLLSESRSLTSPVVRERVIRNVLARYVVHDRSVPNKTGHHHRIPHFLLNDVVRYWRTIASDFASKMWERQRKGWGIRNIKLRFSRKMIFIWGLLAAFSGELFATPQLNTAQTEDEFLRLLSDLIREQTDLSPLDLLARIAASSSVTATTANDVFSAYDDFLAAISDKAVRAELEGVEFDQARDNEAFDRLRESSKRFRAGIDAIFFDQHPVLKRLIRDYGVF